MKIYLKPLLVVGPILLILAFAFSYYLSPSRAVVPPEVVQLKQMESAGLPDFTTKTWEQKDFTLANHKGKVVIINFWASWCAPCVEEIPSLIKLIEHYKGQVRLVAVSGDSDKKDIEVFLKSFPGLVHENIDLVWDQDHKLMNQFGVERLPESFISNPSMKLAKKITGTINWYTPDSRAYMDTLIKIPVTN